MKSGRKTGWSKTADQVGDDADPEFTSEDPSLGPEQERARSKNAPSSATLRSQAGTPHVKGQARKPPKRGYLDGQMLIAMPTMGDERFARGDGPKSAILALGYAGWAPGQLETEIQQNGWLHCPADPDLIFGQDTGRKYDRALRKIGIDLGMLSTEAGHA